MAISKGKHYLVDFEITLKAPFMTKGTGAMRFGLDTFSQSENGNLVMNGSQSRGVIRHQLESFASLLDDSLLQGLINYAFGPASQGDDYKQFHGSALTFPWKLEEQENETLSSNICNEKLYRIKINEATGVVEEGHIQVIETKYPVGSEVTFTGQGLYVETEQYPAHLLELWLNKALQTIDAIGAFKTVGFGEIVKAKCSFGARQHQGMGHQSLKTLMSKPLRVAFKADRPICFAKPRAKTSNLFSSQEYIPGNAIKAALVNSRYYQELEQDAPLKRYIDDLVISHAKPVALNSSTEEVTDTDRAHRTAAHHTPAKTIPLSLLQFSIPEVGSIYFDAAQITSPIVLKNEDAIYAGAFATDAKNAPCSSVLEEYGAVAPKLARELIVRTAVNADTNSADNSQLFSYEAVSHRNVVWVTQFSLPNVDACGRSIEPAQSEVLGQQILEVLNQGLNNLGKTKAFLSYQDHCQPVDEPVELKASQYLSIKLESDALLFENQDIENALVNSEEPLLHVLKHYFSQHVFLNIEVPLIACYADTKVVGGDYVFKRFNNGKSYTPQILVKAGSVLTFDISQLNIAQKEQVAQTVERLIHTGLPSSSSTIAKANSQGSEVKLFQVTPYLPQNGFGQISWLTESMIAKYTSLPSGYSLVHLEQHQSVGGQDD